MVQEVSKPLLWKEINMHVHHFSGFTYCIVEVNKDFLKLVHKNLG